MLTSNLLRLGSFCGSLEVIKRHLLNQIIGFILSLAHQSSSYSHINSGPHRLGPTVTEGLDYHPTLKTIMGVQTLQIFKTFPGFIELLVISLQKVSYLIP